MAINDSNTLNDNRPSDSNVSQAIKREQRTLPPAGPEYDHVLSVFKKIMKDEGAAANFTQSLYRIAQETGTRVISILESLIRQQHCMACKTPPDLIIMPVGMC